MMDDELNRLLDNIGESNDYTQARDNKLRSNELQARKSDRITGDDFAGQSFEEYENYINKLRQDKEILLFKCGYVNIFKPHTKNSKMIEQELNAIDLPSSVAISLKKYKYSYLRNTENIVKYYDDFLSAQNDSSLKKKARLDFELFFSNQDYSENRINFLILKEMFLRLREYNSFIRKEYEELRTGIDAISMVPDGKGLYSTLADIISGALSYCRKTDRFVSFLGLMLSISENDTNVLEKDIFNRIFYRDEISYDYESLFDDSKNEAYEKVHPDEDSKTSKIQIHSDNSLNTARHKIQNGKNSDDQQTDSFDLNYPGNSGWNTKEPYIVHIDNNAYQKNLDDLSKTVYFTKSEEDAKSINANLKRAMLRNITGSADDRSDEYSSFVSKFIFDICSFFSKKLEINSSETDILVYHFGVENMFKVLKSVFEKEMIGLCFKELEKNRLVRFIPDEFLKFSVNMWYENNINSKSIPFNSIQQFNDIKTLVEKRYEQELRINMQKIDIAAKQYQQQSGKTIDRKILLRKKSKELFTLPMMYLFKRFVEKTVF